MKYLFRFTFLLAVAACLAAAFGSCGALGIATESYVEQRVDAIDTKVTEAAVDVAAPVDDLLPGYAAFVRGAYTERPVAPPPPVDRTFPWIEVISIVGAAVGVSVPAAVQATNVIRDSRREKRGEPVQILKNEAPVA